MKLMPIVLGGNLLKQSHFNPNLDSNYLHHNVWGEITWSMAVLLKFGMDK